MKKWPAKAGIHLFPIVAMSLFLCGCGASKKTIPLKETLGGAVVGLDGSSIEASHLLGTDYLLLYFSAHWCPPCKSFTPKFTEFYNTHGGGELFHAVLVSSDRSENEMFAYMRETRMPWPAVRFGSANSKTLQDTYSGDGIPRLVLVDPQGMVIADSFEGKKYLGPQHVLNYLKEQIGGPVNTPNPTAKPATKPSTAEEFAQRFTLNGVGKRSDQSIAIINGNVVSAGDELDQGVVVEKITDAHVDLSFEGKRYRLYPQTTPSSATGTSAPPKNR